MISLVLRVRSEIVFSPFFVVVSSVCRKIDTNKAKQNFDPDETRTRNLLIRSQTPYPLGHEAADTLTSLIGYEYICRRYFG